MNNGLWRYFGNILSYLSNYDIIEIASLSKNINMFIKKYLKLEIIEYDCDNVYDIIRIYPN